MANDLMNFGNLQIVAETEKAVCVAYREREIWLPKSQVQFVTVETGIYAGQVEILIPSWLAARNRMMY